MVFARLVGPLVAGLVLVCAGCTTFDTEREDVVTFVFSQPTTECEVYIGNNSIGRVSLARPAVGVPVPVVDDLLGPLHGGLGSADLLLARSNHLAGPHDFAATEYGRFNCEPGY